MEKNILGTFIWLKEEQKMKNGGKLKEKMRGYNRGTQNEEWR